MQNTKVVRYKAMNWMRVIAFLFIIVYHFMVELEQKGNLDPQKSRLIHYSNSNLHIAIIGVSLFFMLSGAGLMLSSTRNWNLKDFYLRRFTKLLIPFYIVEIFTLIAAFAIKPEWLSNFSNLNKGKIIFNLFGMDGYFEQFYPTFSLHVGEWFLGALIMLYALFPIFRFFMEKNRYITITVATIYYLVMNYGNFISPSPWTNVFIKAYDFILGMFLIIEIPRLLKNKTLKSALFVISAFIIVLGAVLESTIPLPQVITNLIYATAIFFFFFSLFSFFSNENNEAKKNSILDNVIVKICAVSYEVFLVHHIIIYYIGDNLEGVIMGRWQIFALFVTEIIIMAAMALLVQKIVKGVNSLIFKKPCISTDKKIESQS